MIRILALALGLIIIAGCGTPEQDPVTLYTSQDQFFAEPILKEFTRTTGLAVRTVFDTESAKTAGLANRLRHEASHPQCDVFWSNEEMHARLLAAEGVFGSNAVMAVGFRLRQMVINTNLLPMEKAPKSLLELTNAEWKGKVVLAYPLYGTTGSHFVALRQQWGEPLWRSWCERLVANHPKVVDGNSVVVKLVGAGEAWIGLTDSDDIAAGRRADLPVQAAPHSHEMLIIPNTISLAGGGRTRTTIALVQYLTSPETLGRLVQAGALDGIEPPKKGLKLAWTNGTADFGAAMQYLKQIFLRS